MHPQVSNPSSRRCLYSRHRGTGTRRRWGESARKSRGEHRQQTCATRAAPPRAGGACVLRRTGETLGCGE
jgi:hypothetical protein